MLNLEERAAKRARPSVEVELRLASGELLQHLSLPSGSIASQIQQKVILPPGQRLRALLHGDKMLLPEDRLEELGTITAVLANLPILHLFDSCSAHELSERHNTWYVYTQEEDVLLADDRLEHNTMETAPALCAELAEALRKTIGEGLKEKMCLSSEASEETGGEVVLISAPGTDAKDACLRALGIRDKVQHVDASVWHEAELEAVNFKGREVSGFNCGPDDPDEDEGVHEGIKAGTALMAKCLSNHFIFGFSNKVTTAPMIWGGYTEGGSIIGVLAGRVWPSSVEFGSF